MYSPQPFEWFLFAMFVASVPFYLLFLCTLIKFRKKDPFDAPFFKQCIALGVGDVLALVNGWSLMKFVKYDWFGLSALAFTKFNTCKFTIMLGWELGLMQHLAVLGMALNRFSALVFPAKHPLMFTKNRTMLLILLTYLLPLVAITPQYFTGFGYIVDNVTGQVGSPIWLDHNWQKGYFTFLLVFNFSINGVTLVLYTIIFYTIHKHNRVMNGIQQQQVDRSDVKLAVYGFVVFLVMFGYGVYAFNMAFNPPGDLEEYELNVLIWDCISDTFSWCNPWLIAICSPKVREHMVALVCCRNPNLVENISRPSPRRSTRKSTKRDTGKHEEIEMEER